MGWTKQKVANKIEWEGGLDEALNWGLSVGHLPDDDPVLRSNFLVMFDHWRQFETAGERFLARLYEGLERE